MQVVNMENEDCKLQKNCKSGQSAILKEILSKHEISEKSSDYRIIKLSSTPNFKYIWGYQEIAPNVEGQLNLQAILYENKINALLEEKANLEAQFKELLQTFNKSRCTQFPIRRGYKVIGRRIKKYVTMLWVARVSA